MIKTNLEGFTSETRGQATHVLSKHVYVCGHPEQLGQVYGLAQEQILSRGATYVLWTYRNSSNDLSAQEEVELGNAIKQMRLMVLLVTKRFLYEPNRARDFEFVMAQKYGIPVLPFLMEAGLENDFNEFADGLQALVPGAQDETEMNMDQKVHFMLQKIFMPTNIMSQLDQSFDARLFLSYRKKDRLYANALMQYMHGLTAMESVSVWYDEFLPVGEGFEAEIAKQMEESDAVLLMVTPSILEKGNYVKTVEYEMAQRLHKPIVAIQVVETELDEIRQAYEGLPEIIDVRKEVNPLFSAVNKAIAVGKEQKGQSWKTLPNLSTEQKRNLAECYLLGYKVEQDKNRALSLFQEAARAGDGPATERLVEIYRYGLCGPKDLGSAIRVQKEYIYRMSDVEVSLQSISDINAEVKILTELCGEAELYDDGFMVNHHMFQMITDYVKKSGDRRAEKYLPAIEVRMAQMLMGLERYGEAVSWAVKALDPLQEENAIYLKAGQSSGPHAQLIFLCYDIIVKAFLAMGKRREAKGCLESLIDYRYQIDQSIPGTDMWAMTYPDCVQLADLYYKDKEYEDARYYYNKAGTCLQKLINAGYMESSPIAQEIFESIIYVDLHMGMVYLELQDLMSAKEFYESAALHINQNANTKIATESIRRMAEAVQGGLNYIYKNI